ncbi:MAG: class I SAM-dependent methyltransferase [Candidatus Binataceae bacterium]
MGKTKYLFGDSDIAARRLELVARVFEESTRAFLLEAAGGRAWGLAVDLGCGAGFTTRLITRTLRCAHAVGLDASESFIRLARAQDTDRTSFAIHDVTSAPFPCGRADLIFCRFLLTHLQDPRTIVARWATQLNPGGLLMIEETESIRTTHPVFARNLQIVEAMLASRSNLLYVGPLVGALGSPGGLKPSRNETRTVPVRNGDAAGMFVLNLNAWKEGEFVRVNYRRESILELEEDLTRIAGEESPAREIVWEMRQATFGRE